jgi:GNAT superfamily N-acetyltransferase
MVSTIFLPFLFRISLHLPFIFLRICDFSPFPQNKWIELEPLPAWRERCIDKNKSSAVDGTPDFHIVLLLDDDVELAEDIQERNSRATIAGAVVVEYYEQVNCGLLTYILVNSKYRGKGLGRILAEKACFTVEDNARGKGHLAGCNAIFLETNSAEKVDPTEDVMPPAQRHEILNKIGLRLLNFDYVQVALDASKNKVNYLLLTVFISPKIPKIEVSSPFFVFIL